MRHPISIRPADVGKRVTIQYFADDGLKQEAVGMLERADISEGEVVFSVRKRDDSLVEVPLKRISAGKVVPAARNR